MRSIAILIALLIPCFGDAQEIVREAFSSFPADTQQLTYTNLEQLRSVAAYPQLRQRLFTTQLRNFEEFLRSTGNDPEKVVDEAVLASRVQAGTNGAAGAIGGIFGLAQGRFQPDQAQQYYAQSKLATAEYRGQQLYSFGSGDDRAQLFFAFLSSSLAAFGRLDELKALLDVRDGARPGLQSNTTFAGWESELEGSGPQWGIATGKAAGMRISELAASGTKFPFDFSTLMDPVLAVLYRVDFGSDIATHITVVCKNSDTAGLLGKMLTWWRDSQPSGAAAGMPAEFSGFLQGLEISASGSRVELNGSAPLSLLGALNH